MQMVHWYEFIALGFYGTYLHLLILTFFVLMGCLHCKISSVTLGAPWEWWPQAEFGGLQLFMNCGCSKFSPFWGICNMVTVYLNFFSSQETALGFGESLNEVKHPSPFQGFYLFSLFLVQKFKAKEGRMLCLCSITMQRNSGLHMHNGCWMEIGFVLSSKVYWAPACLNLNIWNYFGTKIGGIGVIHNSSLYTNPSFFACSIVLSKGKADMGWSWPTCIPMQNHIRITSPPIS